MTELRNIYITDPSDSTRQAKMDPIFKVPIVVTVPHYEIHEGDSFVTWYADTTMGLHGKMSIGMKSINCSNKHRSLS